MQRDMTSRHNAGREVARGCIAECSCAGRCTHHLHGLILLVGHISLRSPKVDLPWGDATGCHVSLMLQRDRAVYLLSTSSLPPHVSRGGQMHANRDPRAFLSIRETCAAVRRSPEPFLPTPTERRAGTGPGFGLTRAGMGPGAKTSADLDVAACVQGCTLLMPSRIVHRIAMKPPLHPAMHRERGLVCMSTSRIGSHLVRWAFENIRLPANFSFAKEEETIYTSDRKLVRSARADRGRSPNPSRWR
jgi:hypothetical protein